MNNALPLILVSVALGAAVLLSRGSGSRESLLPLSRAVAEQEKGLDRAAGAAFPLSPDEERRIGEGLDRGLAHVESARLGEFGETAAGSPLVTRFRGRYVFRATPSGGLNAFALPGGFVYATEPFLKRLQGDGDALLFALGHEIGHVELGHCADAYRLRGALSVARLFAQLHFNPSQELEADAYAVRLMRSLGRDPRAGLRVFDALGLPAGARTKRGPGEVVLEGAADYFRTHPGSWERRAALEREAAAAAR